MWGSKRTLNTEDDESSDVQPLTTGDLLGLEQHEDNEEEAGAGGGAGGERLLQEFPSSEHSSSARSGSDDGGGGAGGTSPSPDVVDEAEEDTSTTTPPPPVSRPDHTAPSNDKEQNDDEPDENENDEKLRPGDHIWTFQWHRGWRHRRHAIVLEVTPRENTSHNLDGEEKEDLITVLTFYPAGDKTRTAKGLMAEAAGGDKEDDETATMSLIDAVDTTEEEDDGAVITSVGGSDSPKRGLQRRSSSRRGENDAASSVTVSVRSEPIELFAGKSKISKVKYNASTKNNNTDEEEKNVLKRVLRRAGTQTSLCPDDATLVVARARHLLSGDGTLPDRPPLSGSDECAAVWCRTGRWCTLRGGSILQILSAGHAGTAVAAGSVVSQATVTYVAPIGMTGWYWIWTVPATVAYPFLIPILVAYGLTSLAPLEVLRRCRKKWRHISDGLNCTFWSKTSEEIKMEYFGRTVSGDEVRMKTFFGESVKDDDDDEGKYMPVNMDGEDSDDDDDDEGDDDDNSGRGGFGFNRKGAMKEAATLETDVASGESSGPPTRRASEGFKNPFEGLVQNWRKKWGDRDGVGSERNLRGNRHNIAEHRALQKMASESLLGKTMPLKEEEEETCQLVQ